MKLSKLTAAIIASAITSSASAETYLDKIFVTDSALLTNDLNTSYSTQAFTSEDIEDSGANNLSEFLTQNTSIVVQPSYGNPLSSSIDMSGYGLESGHENVQIIVDGVSLTNIDGTPVQLSAISLNSIKEITILRGSGSVLYGNGASAGAIVIRTHNAFGGEDKFKALMQTGSYGTNRQLIAMHETGQHQGYDLFADVKIDLFRSDGSIKVKADGSQNSTDNRTLSAAMGAKKGKASIIASLEKNSATVTYPGYVDVAVFEQNPSADQTTGTSQEYNTLTSKLLAAYAITDNTKASYTLTNVDKDSAYIDFGSRFDYTQTEHKLDFKTQFSSALLKYGVSKKQAVRNSQGFSVNSTSRNDSTVYASLNVEASKSVNVNVGARKQSFDYNYTSSTADNSKSEDLASYNLGVSWLIDQQRSVYANLNHAFLAPSIDRFFDFSGNFNGFIDSQKSDTLSLGYKVKTDNSDFNIEAFKTELKDEIYYNKASFQNTNIDSSSKHGINLSIERFYDKLITGMNYSFVDAQINQESGTSYSGKAMPGVSEHTLKLFAQYDFNSSLIASLPNHRLRLTHKASSEVYAISDFDNSNSRQSGYQSTDISYRMANKQLALQFGVNNLLDNANGLYAEDGAGEVKVYPTNYERNFYIRADLTM